MNLARKQQSQQSQRLRRANGKKGEKKECGSSSLPPSSSESRARALVRYTKKNAIKKEEKTR